MSKQSQIENVSQNGFGELVEIYYKQIGQNGDYYHQNLVNPALLRYCKDFH